MADRIAVEKQLTKQNNRMDAFNGKRLTPQEWTQELLEQVYALNLICLQQQGDIEKLQMELRNVRQFLRKETDFI